MIVKQAHQGDVFIKYVDNMTTMENLEPVERDEHGRYVLALGEASGHAHAIHNKSVALFRDKVSGAVFGIAVKDYTLYHEYSNRKLTADHALIQFPIGNFQVKQQRCYTPEAIKNVAD